MSKYKEGDKFVIEIDNVITSDNGTLYSIKGFNALILDAFGLNKLSQVTDSVAEDKFNKGAEDAWELAKLISIYTQNGGLSNYELSKIFETSCRDSIFRNNTYKEAKAKFDTWEKAKEEIKVGDVVNIKNDRNASGIVFAIKGEWCSLAWSDGYCGSYLATDLIKTGKNHADEVTDLIGLLK